jgi:hypothetical protein
MRKPAITILAAFAMSALIAGVSGCKKEEGPAEKAGRAMDKAVDSASKQIEKAGQAIQDTAKDKK